MPKEIILVDTQETPWYKEILAAFPDQKIHQLKCSEDAKILILKLRESGQDALAVIARFPLPRYLGEEPNMLYTTVLCQCVQPHLTRLIFVADQQNMYLAPIGVQPWKGPHLRIIEENIGTGPEIIDLLKWII